MRDVDRFTGGKPIIGQRLGDPTDEAEHFYTCAHCGQEVDKRDLGAVMWHEQRPHDPLPREDAERIGDARGCFRRSWR